MQEGSGARIGLRAAAGHVQVHPTTTGLHHVQVHPTTTGLHHVQVHPTTTGLHHPAPKPEPESARKDVLLVLQDAGRRDSSR
jgi:hypothetical protein